MPSTSSTTVSQITSIFGLAKRRFCRIFSARKRIAAVDHRDLVGEVGEEQRFLDGGVAAADDRDLAVLVEEAVAGGAGRDAEAAELLLGGQVQPVRLRAGRDDQRVAGVGVAAIAV